MFSASCPLRNSPAVEVVPRFVPNSGTLQRIPAHEHVLRVGMLTWQSLPGEARSCWLETWGMGRDLPLGSEFEVAPASPGFARRSDCTSVAWAPRGSESGRRPSLADSVRGRGPSGRRPPPERAHADYPLTCAPSEANLSATALPMLRREPVTSATLPSSFPWWRPPSIDVRRRRL